MSIYQARLSPGGYICKDGQMMLSQKQLKANRKNARKGGVKTDEGKAIAKYNALKHGLLTPEAVLAMGGQSLFPKVFQCHTFSEGPRT